MFLRRLAILALPAALVLSGCSSLQTISVSPAAGSVSVGVGQTAQFRAYGASQMGSGIPTTSDITNSVSWSVANPNVASISSTGVATGLTLGHTTINAASGGITASSDITVVAAGSGAGSGSGSSSLDLIPGAATASFVGETTQFIALGNLSGGATIQDLTGSVTWKSSDVGVASIDQNGLATAVGAITGTGTTTITAIGTSSTGSLITATATLAVTTTPGTVTLPSLSVYLTGAGTGTVTSGAPNAGTINCGSAPSASACTANYSLSTVVTLTAAPTGTSKFGGWSSNCIAVTGPPPNPLQCTVQMNNNKAVGAVFNP